MPRAAKTWRNAKWFNSESSTGARRGPNRPGTPDDVGDRNNEVSKPSIAELSRRLAERAARQRAVDPAAVKTARRAALEAYDRTRARRQRLVLGLAGGAIACSSIIYLVPTPGSRVAPSPSAALPEPALLLSIAVATPIPALPDPASPSQHRRRRR